MSEPRQINIKPIRSFVRREGRFTTRQKNAIEATDNPNLINIQNGVITLTDKPIIIEIGFGMGQSFLEMAKADPEKQFIGIEVYNPGVGSVLAAIHEKQIKNILVIAEDAKEALPACIADSSIDGINIFFSDPWPKKRHHKRRLIQPDFVELLTQKLKLGGKLHLATDWQNYAEHMLEVLENAQYLENTNPNGGYAESRYDRPMTKYEKRGLTLGHEVWDLVFEKQPNSLSCIHSI